MHQGSGVTLRGFPNVFNIDCVEQIGYNVVLEAVCNRKKYLRYLCN